MLKNQPIQILTIRQKYFFCTVALLCHFFYCSAATITSTTSGGSWNEGSTWIGGSRPGSSDDVIIAPNAMVTMDAANIAAGILSLTVSSGSTLMLGASTANNLRFNIKGNIVNNGSINFWLSGTQGMSLYLTGSSSTWSGNGIWNLAQLFISDASLEFGEDIFVTINRSITVGNGSLNKANKRSKVLFNLSGTENATIASASSSIYYSSIIVDKANRITTFATSAALEPYNTINILGDLTINPNNRLAVGTNNTLEIRNNLSGSGRITGGTTSDIQITGNEPSVLFNSGGSGFRNFTVTRPNGITIDSTISIAQTLSLQNQCKVYLPAGKAANGNQTFSVGQSATTGAIIGDGYLAQQPWTNAYQLTDLTINGTAQHVNLRFSQSPKENIIRNFSINKLAGSINLLDGGILQVRNNFSLTAGNLSIGAGTLKLTGAITISINGTLSGSPDANLIIDNEVSSAASTIYFNQTDAQSRSLNTYTQTRNGTIRLGNALDIYNLIDLNSTSTANILNTGSNLTLISNETGTARVNNLGSASIVDSVIVQRFIKGGNISRRSYRLLSSPVYQVNAGNISLRRSYFSRLQDQILITGSGGTVNGFDPSPANGPTIWKYNEPAASNALQDFIPISSISKNHSITSQDFLNPGNGFFLFFRGDRFNNLNNKTTAPFSVPEDVIISYKGLLNQGNITVTTPYSTGTGFMSYTDRSEVNDGFNLVGNPYPSAIDWELSGGSGSSIALNNINSTIYILDPVTKNYGTYTKGGLNTGLATRYIASGQGFFVKANAANPTLLFTESAKTNDTSNPAVLGGKTNADIDFLRLSLEKDSLNKDDILITFKEKQSEDFNQEEDVEDLPGMSAAVSLSSLSKTEKKQLAVNALPPINQVIKTSIFVDAITSGKYKLKLTDLSENLKNQHIFLKDNFTSDSVAIRLHDEYTFSIDKNSIASYGNNRFLLYFRPILPALTINPVLLSPPNTAEISSAMLFPNPSSSEINILLPKNSPDKIGVNIYSTNGTKVMVAVYKNQNPLKHNISKLIPGTYIIELMDELTKKPLARLKFIKQ